MSLDLQHNLRVSDMIVLIHKFINDMEGLKKTFF
jgi:hypothetical protein